MTRRFKWFVGFSLLLIGTSMTAPRPVPADRLPADRWCDTATPAAAAIEHLVDEAAAAGMSEALLNRLLAVGYRNERDPEALRQILCVVIQAEEDGLPPAMLFEKIEEGLGKQVPLPKILPVVQARVGDLAQARTMLTGRKPDLTDDPDVERVARVLAMQVPAAEVARLLDSVPSTPLAMRVIAVEILGYGQAMQLAPELIQQVIQTGMANRAFTPDWAYFVKVVAAARKRGLPDKETVAAAVAVLGENGTIEELAGELDLKIRGLTKPSRN
jgi:hypothetical protein